MATEFTATHFDFERMIENAVGPTVYRFGFLIRLCAYGGVLMFGALAAVAWKTDPLAAAGSLGIAAFYAWFGRHAAVRVSVDEERITVSKPLSAPRSVAWHELLDVGPHAMTSRMVLRSRGGDALKLSNQLVGYPALVAEVRRRRPDLFVVRGLTRFHRTHTTTYLMLGLSAILLAMAVFLPDEGNADDTAGRLILVGMALFMPLTLLTELRGVAIEGDHVRLRYPFREKRIRRDEVQRIGFAEHAGQYGTRGTLLRIYRHRGKPIVLAGFREGTLELSEALLAWHRADARPSAA